MRAVLGIDFGTTNSSCAYLDGERAVLVPNERGLRVTPSVVAFSGDRILVGESARNQAVANPRDTIKAVKRMIGTGERPRAGGRAWRPEEIASLIIAKLKADAEEYLGAPALEAVITVPAYFADGQRKSVIEAGCLAGLAVRRIVNEPTAAAIAYSYLRSKEGPDSRGAKALVYDLGGGTFDVTVLEVGDSSCEVLSSRGDPALGGIDFDRMIYARAAESFFEEKAISVSDEPALARQLEELAERAKIELSSSPRATIAMPFASGREHLEFAITTEEFEAMVLPLVRKTIELSARAIAEAGLAPGDIDRLVLSGGSSRMPLVRRLLQEEFGLRWEGRVNPEEIVASGAAVLGAIDAGSERGFRVSEVASFSYGVETEGGLFAPVVRKNERLPAARKRSFTTVVDHQSEVEIHVLQGEAEKAEGCASLGRFILSGIARAPKGEARIEVEFQIDADDILRVRAYDPGTGAEQEVTLAADAPPAGPQGAAKRLASLAARLRTYGAPLDQDFAREVAESLALADSALASGDQAAVARALRIAEAAIGELEAERRLGA